MSSSDLLPPPPPFRPCSSSSAVAAASFASTVFRTPRTTRLLPTRRAPAPMPAGMRSCLPAASRVGLARARRTGTSPTGSRRKSHPVCAGGSRLEMTFVAPGARARLMVRAALSVFSRARRRLGRRRCARTKGTGAHGRRTARVGVWGCSDAPREPPGNPRPKVTKSTWRLSGSYKRILARRLAFRDRSARANSLAAPRTLRILPRKFR